ncbi:CsbD family protein [Rothia sp. CCM 9417]|uniref:CsbD family protein n=1 Tax=unclassified Rothia (in: high G+C Gram-positive bacteria) TaxID=2689056 RepID=UPI003ACC26FA
MAAEEKFENGLDNLAGKAKEAGGKLTGNDHLEAEGKTDQVKAQAQDKVEDAKQAVSDGIDKVKETFSGIADSFKKD